MLYIIGGDEDPNIARLISRLKSMRIRHRGLLVGKHNHPRITWNMKNDELRINGRVAEISSAFIRHDVFTNIADERQETSYRAYAWYSALASWISAHEKIKCFNRDSKGELLKPAQLHLAAKVGLPIPDSHISNDIKLLTRENAKSNLVVKPINGGDYCQPLSPLLSQIDTLNGVAASPAIVQEELVPPDVRVFKIGSRLITFEIESDALDYRAGSFSNVIPSNIVPRQQLRLIDKVSKKMGLDFSATDLKWSEDRKSLVFLEVNSAPMFAAFDHASKGSVCAAIAEHMV